MGFKPRQRRVVVHFFPSSVHTITRSYCHVCAGAVIIELNKRCGHLLEALELVMNSHGTAYTDACERARAVLKGLR